MRIRPPRELGVLQLLAIAAVLVMLAAVVA